MSEKVNYKSKYGNISHFIGGVYMIELRCKVIGERRLNYEKVDYMLYYGGGIVNLRRSGGFQCLF